MSFAGYCVVLTFALALLADVSVAEESKYYPNKSLQYVNEMHEATKSHEDNLNFIKKMMEVDYLWWSILSEPVIVKQPSLEYFDHYNEKQIEYNNTTVLPFKSILEMFNENTFTGSEIMLVMDALKSGMACSVLKHISFQGLMVYALLTKYSVQDKERKLADGWLIQMVQLAIDKLTAMDNSEDPGQPITRVRGLLIDMWHTLLKTPDAILTNKMRDIGLNMYKEINNTCAGDNYYKALVNNLNRKNMVEELMVHRTQFTETLKEAPEMQDIELLLDIKGEIIIDENITANDIANGPKIKKDTMLRTMHANHRQMNFFYLNMPIQTFADSHWPTLNKIIKPRLPEEHSTPSNSM